MKANTETTRPFKGEDEMGKGEHVDQEDTKVGPQRAIAEDTQEDVP